MRRWRWDLLKRMAENRADFTLTFRRLCVFRRGNGRRRGSTGGLFADPSAYDAWAAAWRQSPRRRARGLGASAMRMANPAFIPRNHMVQAVLDAAIERQDFQPFEELLDVVSRPYEDRPGLERYTTPARPEECVSQTFCGTIETVAEGFC